MAIPKKKKVKSKTNNSSNINNNTSNAHLLKQQQRLLKRTGGSTNTNTTGSSGNNNGTNTNSMDNGGSSSEENEASLQDLQEEDSSDEDDDDDNSNNESSSDNNSDDDEEEEGEVQMGTKQKHNKRRKQQQQQLNHDSAAHKIQNQFRREKGKGNMHDFTTTNNKTTITATGPLGGTLNNATHAMAASANSTNNNSINNTSATAVRTKKKSKKRRAVEQSEIAVAASLYSGQSDNSEGIILGKDEHDPYGKKITKIGSVSSKHSDNDDDDSEDSSSTTTDWTVSPPSRSVLDHHTAGLSVEACRKSITTGLRVKVHFDGSAWYGGRVSNVNQDGSKIRIRYDDGTREYTPFPDKAVQKQGASSVDIVVDAVRNGQHAAAAAEAARVFMPPDDAAVPPRTPAAIAAATTVQTASLTTATTTVIASSSAASRIESTEALSHDLAPIQSIATTTTTSQQQLPIGSANMPPQNKQIPLNVEMHYNSDTEEEEGEVVESQGKPLGSDAIGNLKGTAIESASKESTTGSSMIIEHVVVAEPTKEANVDVDNGMDVDTATHNSPRDLDAHSKGQAIEINASENLPKPKKKRGRPPKQKTPDALHAPEEECQDTLDRDYRDDDAEAQPTDDVETEKDIAKAAEGPLASDRATVATKSLPLLKIRMPKASGDFGPKHAKSPRSPSFILGRSDRNDSHLRIPSPVTQQKNEPLSAGSPSGIDPPPAKKLSIRIPVHKVKQTLHEAGLRSPAIGLLASELRKGDRSTSYSAMPLDSVRSPKSEMKDALEKTRSLGDPTVNIENSKLSASLSVLPSSPRSQMSPKQIKKLKRKPLLLATTANAETSAADIVNKVENAPVASVFSGSDRPNMDKVKSGEEPVLVVVQKTETDVISGMEKTYDNFSAAANDTMIVEKPDSPSFTDTSATVDNKKQTTEEHIEMIDFALDCSIRSERKAAQQANERIVAKQDVAIPVPLLIKKKKKRERQKEIEDGNIPINVNVEESEGDSQWAQCDKCGKWRVIPSNVVQLLPKQWYCSDNTYDPLRASCDAPEQTAKEVAKEKKKRLKKRQRMMKAAEAAKEVVVSSAIKPEATTKRETKDAEAPPVHKEKTSEGRSPRPSRENASDEKEKPPRAPKRSSPIDDDVQMSDVAVAVLPIMDARSKKEKGKKIRSAAHVEPVEKVVSPPVELAAASSSIDVVKPRGRGRPRRNQGKEPPVGGGGGSSNNNNNGLSGGTDDADNLEWVQCEKCDKWRKLPPHVSADELPDVWTCNLNDWNPSSASCDAPEDKAEGLQDIGVFGSSGASAGKMTYRHLIFGGTGRKANRPISERTRASESLFAAHFDEDDAPTKVLYADSSAYISRGRSSVPVDDALQISMFELMSHSHLWQELRGVAQPLSQQSNESILNSYTFDTLPRDVQQPVKDFVLHVLNGSVVALSGDDIVNKINHESVDALPEGFRKAQSFCTKNVVITALCQLVKDGTLDCIQKARSSWPMCDWNPHYRVALKAPAPPAVLPPPPRPLLLETKGCQTTTHNTTNIIKSSRFMKISKPWKRTIGEDDASKRVP